MRHFRSGISRRQNGFTLIELLVVIAIIAILTAILLPVFSSVRENARQSSSLGSMHQISTAIAQFTLDNHKAPVVLFGYAYSGPGGTGTPSPMSSAYDAAVADDAIAKDNNAIVNQYFPGLYPEYVKDYRVFTDGNNTDTDKAGSQTAATAKTDRVSADVNTLASSGNLTLDTTKSFYKADAYDVSPAITGANSLSTGTKAVYVARYQSSWTDIMNCSSAMPPAFCTDPTYTHQLRWKNPPATSYVTSTTYHVPQAGRVLVLWEDGSARKVDTGVFLGNTTTETPTTVAVTGSSGSQVSGANFWKLSPTGP